MAKSGNLLHSFFDSFPHRYTGDGIRRSPCHLILADHLHQTPTTFQDLFIQGFASFYLICIAHDSRSDTRECTLSSNMNQFVDHRTMCNVSLVSSSYWIMKLPGALLQHVRELGMLRWSLVISHHRPRRCLSQVRGTMFLLLSIELEYAL